MSDKDPKMLWCNCMGPDMTSSHTHTNTHQTKPNNCAPKKLAMKGKKNVELKLLHLLFSHRHLQKQTQHAYACTKRGSAYMIFHGITQGCLCIYALCLSLCYLDPLSLADVPELFLSSSVCSPYGLKKFLTRCARNTAATRLRIHPLTLVQRDKNQRYISDLTKFLLKTHLSMQSIR